MRTGQQVTARKTVLGHIRKPSNHVHLTEYEGGRVVNPLVPGRLTPYRRFVEADDPVDRAAPTDSGPEVLPTFVRGRVEIAVNAEDSPPSLARCGWHGPVTPALLTWQIRNIAGRDVVPQHVAFDFRASVPANSAFWRVYARGTYQNQTVFGTHYSYLQRGTYLFKLAQRFNTRTLRDGVYDLIVKASDIRGNSSSQTLRFTVHNRSGWSDDEAARRDLHSGAPREAPPQPSFCSHVGTDMCRRRLIDDEARASSHCCALASGVDSPGRCTGSIPRERILRLSGSCLRSRRSWRVHADSSFIEFPPVLDDGRLFLGTNHGLVLAVQCEYRTRRYGTASSTGCVAASPAVGNGRRLPRLHGSASRAAGTAPSFVAALDARTGKTVWRFQAGVVEDVSAARRGTRLLRFVGPS